MGSEVRASAVEVDLPRPLPSTDRHTLLLSAIHSLRQARHHLRALLQPGLAAMTKLQDSAGEAGGQKSLLLGRTTQLQTARLAGQQALCSLSLLQAQKPFQLLKASRTSLRQGQQLQKQPL